MDSTRQQKVSKLIQKELGDVFQHESRNLFGSAFITITEVQISPDMSIAKIYLSILAVKDVKKMLEQIKENVKPLRKELGIRVKNQLRIVPNLTFFIDDTVERADRIDQLLKGTRKPENN